MATNNKYALAIKARQDADKRQGTLPKTTNKYALGVYYNAPVADHRPSPVMRLETKNERMPVKPVASTVTVQDQYRPKTPWFTPNILNPVANQNSTLVGKATGGSAQSKKEFDFAGAEKRIAELVDKIARMQNDPSTEAVRSKQTELLVYRTQYEGLKKDYEKAKADKWYADTGNEIASSVMAGNDGLWGNLRNVAELSDLDMAERMAMNAPGVGSITTSVQDELNAAKAKLPANVDADWLEYARQVNESKTYDDTVAQAAHGTSTLEDGGVSLSGEIAKLHVHHAGGGETADQYVKQGSHHQQAPKREKHVVEHVKGAAGCGLVQFHFDA